MIASSKIAVPNTFFFSEFLPVFVAPEVEFTLAYFRESPLDTFREMTALGRTLESSTCQNDPRNGSYERSGCPSCDLHKEQRQGCRWRSHMKCGNGVENTMCFRGSGEAIK